MQLGVNTAVGFMAVHAVLLNRGMLPKKRSAFVGMTGVTEFVYRVCLDHALAQRTVRIMAAAAFEFPFYDRMMGPLINFSSCILMTFDACFVLFGMHILLMYGMTVRTGHIILLVSTQAPEDQQPPIFMAREAFFSLLFCTVFRSEGEYAGTLAAALFNMS